MKKAIISATTAFAIAAVFAMQPAQGSDANLQATGTLPAQTSSSPTASRAEVEHAIHDQWLRRINVEPGSSKARIIDSWAEKIRLEGTTPLGGQGEHLTIQSIMDNPELRTPFVLSGLARISPEDRLEYTRMASSFFDRFVPQDCFGLTDQQQIMAKAMAVDKMSDSEADEFFGLIYKMVHASAVRAPIDVPSASQHTAAVSKLGVAMEAMVPNDKADIDRFAAFIVDPSRASTVDKCWITGLSMHAIISMGEPDRDIILRYAFALGAMKAQQAGASQPGSTLGAPVPHPTSAIPGGVSKL